MTTEDKDLAVHEQEDGSVVIGDAPEVEKEVAPQEPEEDARPVDNEDAHDDEAATEGEDAETAEARRERNRQRRTQNKESRKNYIESLKRELSARDAVINDLSTRVASVERQATGSQMSQLDNAIKEASDVYNHFKELNRRAIEAVDGTAAVDAQEKMFAATQRHQMLLNAKKNMVNQQQAPAPLDPRLASHANSWMERNSWYDPSGTDADSDLVLKLDDRLAREGWNPTTSEYWEELDARVKKYLPHRTKAVYNAPKNAPRVPVAGSDRENSSGTKQSYHLSAERVKALKDAGAWEDASARADAIKRYKEYDAAQAANK